MRWSPAPDSTRTPIASPCWDGTALERFCRCNRSGTWPKPSSTSWSRPLADEWERYIRQQIELGGAELVLSAAVGQGSHPEQSEGSLRLTPGRDLDMTSTQPIPR